MGVAGWTAGISTILLLAIAWLVLRARAYRSWWQFPAVRDDRLPAADLRLAVDLVASAGVLEVSAPADRTTLLRLNLEARWLGKWFDPCLQLERDGRRWRQVFERGVGGTRYIDLTPVLAGVAPEATARVSLHSRHLRWRASAELSLFEPPSPTARVLVLAPHPDDAEIAAFGQYCSRESWVVTLTAGELSATGAEAETRALRRVEESLRVPQEAGVPPERCVNLVFPDGALGAMAGTPQLPRLLACEPAMPRARLRALNADARFREAASACLWEDLVADIHGLLELARPDAVIAPHPGLDTHSDHIACARALSLALARCQTPPGELWLYAVHLAGSPAHPLGPADSLAALAPGPSAARADSIYSHVLSPGAQQAKRRALESMSAVRCSAHLGRRQRLTARLAGLGATPASLLRRAVRPQEIFYRVNSGRLARLLDATDAEASS